MTICVRWLLVQTSEEVPLATVMLHVIYNNIQTVRIFRPVEVFCFLFIDSYETNQIITVNISQMKQTNGKISKFLKKIVT